MSDFEVIADTLNDLGYATGELTSESLENILNKNIVEFSKIISMLSCQLSQLLNLEETINDIETNSASDVSTFNLEISSFLKELPCPYRNLTGGLIEERFKSVENKLDLLEFLTTELEAAQIASLNNPQIIKSSNSLQSSNESEETKSLTKLLKALGLSKPPENITIKEIWQKVHAQLGNVLSKLPKDYLGKALLTADLTEKQWQQLMHINQILCDDFQMRRELLLTRLDVTIQSFKWADNMKKNNNEITNLYQKYRKEFHVRPNIKLYHTLSARDDLLKQEKTCSTRIMTKSHLHKIIIPKPPDRGGRTCELEAPPVEMPSFSQRRHTANPQNQRQQNRGGGHNKRGHGNQKWNEPRRPQSEFERFQNADYGNNQDVSGSGNNYQRGGGGRGRGGRGRGGGSGRY